eukprot:2721220-Lingulodinium_polyedra.AAC.1
MAPWRTVTGLTTGAEMVAPDTQVLIAMGKPPIEVRLRLERLALLRRIVQRGHAFLLCVLDVETGWRAQVLDDIAWLAE